MGREEKPLQTKFDGISYRSRTEARWAVFFKELGVAFTYEPRQIRLSNGEHYLPDFFIRDFGAYFEVKPANDAIVTEECRKARQLAFDLQGEPVWLAMGIPEAEAPNILLLNE